jgi:hypothetical protein
MPITAKTIIPPYTKKCTNELTKFSAETTVLCNQDVAPGKTSKYTINPIIAIKRIAPIFNTPSDRPLLLDLTELIKAPHLYIDIPLYNHSPGQVYRDSPVFRTTERDKILKGVL